MWIERGKLMQQSDAVLVGLAHAENPAAADCDPGVAYRCNCAQTVFVGARRDDLAVELR